MADKTADFQDLKLLRGKVERVAHDHMSTLSQFHLGEPLDIAPGSIRVKGFRSEINFTGREEVNSNRVSLASSASCVRSLLGSELLKFDDIDFSELQKSINHRYHEGQLDSNGLEADNPFTISLLLPLLRWSGFVEKDNIVQHCKRKAVERLKEGDGGVRFNQQLSSNSYLTYWTLRGLEAFGWDTEREASVRWAKQQFHRQVALFACHNEDESDSFQLGYSFLILKRYSPDALVAGLTELALQMLFTAQLGRGVWEKKEPLLINSKFGNAYCFPFELLTALIEEFAEETEVLRPYRSNFENSFNWIERNALSRSGHNMWRSSNYAARRQRPESWATAEIFYFLHQFQRLLSRQIETLVLSYFDGVYRCQPIEITDSEIKTIAQPKVIKEDLGLSEFLLEFIYKQMVAPLKKSDFSHKETKRYTLSRYLHASGHPRSAILYGPPGTGKTSLVKKIAKLLGWSVVTLDPSDFAADGLPFIATRTTEIFSYLNELDDVVIFFDEMEELTRERGTREREQNPTSFEQKFLTTILLPKLQTLHDRGRTVFFLATNYKDHIDQAARRLGRFDYELPVLAPAPSEKKRVIRDSNLKENLLLGEKLDELFERLDRLPDDVLSDDLIHEELWWLTWPETMNLLKALGEGKELDSLLSGTAGSEDMRKQYLSDARHARITK